MRKLVHTICDFRVLLLVLPLVGAMPAFAQGPDQGAKTAEQVYKNIQCFKGAPAPRVMEAMKAFKEALGVKCSFCHVEGAFDKDDKPEKQTARKMIAMAHGINKDNFGGEHKVSCWTCHRGSPEPETKPKAQ